MSRNAMILLGLGGAGLAYMLFSKSGGLGVTPAPAGGYRSVSPSTRAPVAVVQAPRADNNPTLNNQPWTNLISGGGAVNTAAGVSSAVASLSDIWGNLSGGSSTDETDSSLDSSSVDSANADAGADNSSG